jgi:putative ABC transport system permease protein
MLASFALHGLWRQKVRTILTLVGVTVGTCALAFSLALGFGLRAFIDNEFKGRDDFWRVVVHVAEPPTNPEDVPSGKVEVTGDMSKDRRERLQTALVERYLSTRQRKPPVPLTDKEIKAIEKLPDVDEVRVFRGGDGRVMAAGAPKPARAFTVSGPLADLKPRLLAGRLPVDREKEIVVSELVLYDLGWRNDADLERALGMPVRLTVGGIRNAPPLALARALMGRLPGDEMTAAQSAVLEKLIDELPKRIDAFDLTPAERAELQRLLQTKRDPDEVRPLDSAITAADTYHVCGVVRILSKEEKKKRTPLESWELMQGDAFLSASVGNELLNRLPWAKEAGVNSVDVRVRPGGDLTGTVAAIENMGYRTLSGAKWFASAKREVTLIAAGLNLFALVALFVAGIGITNTLVTSVVERTKEIGILRAVGATRAQILGLFLAEGMFIGLVGSGLGLSLARGLAVPADRWVWGMIEKVAEGDKLLGTTVFVFPWWLYVASMVFAVLVTTAAAYYPARRAAKIHPIEALRYG